MITKSVNTLLKSLLFIGLLTINNSISYAKDLNLPIWKVTSKNNCIYFIGGLDFYKEKDKVLFENYSNVFNKVEKIVIEVNFDSLNSASYDSLLSKITSNSNGERLNTYLRKDTYERLKKITSTFGLNLELWENKQPYFLAISLLGCKMISEGFNLDDCRLDDYFFSKAKKYNKKIIALESSKFNLTFLSTMPLEIQESYLLMILESIETLDSSYQENIALLKSGNIAELQNKRASEFTKYPKVCNFIIDKRINPWILKIKEFLKDKEDYLIITELGFLTGQEGILNKLKNEKYSIEMLK